MKMMYNTSGKVKPSKTQELSPYKDSRCFLDYAADLKTPEHQNPPPSETGGIPKNVACAFINIILNAICWAAMEHMKNTRTYNISFIYLKECISISSYIWGQPFLQIYEFFPKSQGSKPNT